MYGTVFQTGSSRVTCYKILIDIVQLCPVPTSRNIIFWNSPGFIFLGKNHVMQCLHLQGGISFSAGTKKPLKPCTLAVHPWRERSKNPPAGMFKHGKTLKTPYQSQVKQHLNGFSHILSIHSGNGE